MDYKDNKHDQNRLFHSFGFAISGIFHTVKNERNMQIHVFVTVLTIILGSMLSLSIIEWLFILSAIAGTLSLELINTAIENTVDLVTEKRHPLAKIAKDVAAGAVLIYALYSVIIGCIIFLPKIYRYL
ncbi:diacylglycerol kinase family protein [Peribacillus alkalitolerans]|uniref:diacylglycerol kinase family protein n=1 Tax=Peribacillus alkalitolerans TaxID=1550385 RepID=UPI0013D3B716|nr:diacylglycerol kinase family protein [Peribacillus alkalitolerans]